MKKIPIPTILTAGVLVLVLVLYAFTYQVRFSHAAVHARLGKADENSVIRDPGIRFRLPWPIDSVTEYDTRIKVLDTADAETKTSDGQQIIVGSYALYRIEDPLVFHTAFKSGGVHDAEERLRDRINAIRRTVIGGVGMSAFVNLDASKVRYDEIEQAMLDGCRSDVLTDFGIDILAIRIRRISLPETATGTVFDNMSAQRARIAATWTEEGAAAAQAIEARANADAEKILAFARRRAEEIKSEGVRAATRVFAQIDKEDSELYLYMKEIDALEAIFQKGTTFFLDTKTELFRVFSDRPGAKRAQTLEQP